MSVGYSIFGASNSVFGVGTLGTFGETRPWCDRERCDRHISKLFAGMRYTRSDFDRRNKALSLHQEPIAKSNQTQKKRFTFYETQVALNFGFLRQSQWSV